MIRIDAVIIQCDGLDETGAPVVKDVLVPASPIPSNAVRVECDGQSYTVYESGDMVP